MSEGDSLVPVSRWSSIPTIKVMQKHMGFHTLDFSDLRISSPAIGGDVGYDLASAIQQTVWPYRRSSLHALRGRSHLLDKLLDRLVGGAPGPSFVALNTGVHIELPDGHWAAILPRSSTNKLGLYVPFSVIDNGYRGELFPMVHNFSNQVVTIEKGQRIAQLVVFPASVFSIKRVSELGSSDRGINGFGSTGG